ncbi:MAG: hypothetical protein KOO61_06630 [Spirochaetales bacterium]|nr:hypothetical protein [Spirochaetales bacterium]
MTAMEARPPNGQWRDTLGSPRGNGAWCAWNRPRLPSKPSPPRTGSLSQQKPSARFVASQLLRPSNQRPDRWGGSFENRTRFIHDAYSAIRQAVTRPDFIVGSRVSLFERLPGGIGSGAGPVEQEDLSEPLELVARLVELKADFLNVTAGDPAVTTDLSIPTRKYRQTAFEHFRYTETVKAHAPGTTVIGSAGRLWRTRHFRYTWRTVTR